MEICSKRRSVLIKLAIVYVMPGMVSNINMSRFSKSCWEKCAAGMTSRDLVPMLVCGGMDGPFSLQRGDLDNKSEVSFSFNFHPLHMSLWAGDM